MNDKYLNDFSGSYFLSYRDNSDYDKANIVILPIGYQGTCSWGKGTKNGPKAIINASYNLEPFDEEALFDLNDTGITTLKPLVFQDKEKAKKVSNLITSVFSEIIKDKKFPVLIGGEHSLSIGAIEAINKHYRDFSVLQFDAHTDLDESYKYEEYHHAAMAKTVLDKTHADITQVGIRSVIPEHLEIAKKNNVKIFFAHDIISRKHKISDIISTLKKNVYITIDVDAFDPSVFPNTGTPEPNGLKWQYVINFISQLTKTHNIIGLDLVEHSSKNPNRPHFSDYSAAKLIHKILCIIFKEKSK